jgi:hypothetical protein
MNKKPIWAHSWKLVEDLEMNLQSFKARCSEHDLQLFVVNRPLMLYECEECVRQGPTIITTDGMKYASLISCVLYEQLLENRDGDVMVYRSLLHAIVARGSGVANVGTRDLPKSSL